MARSSSRNSTDTSSRANSRTRSDRMRTRSTTRPRRVEVDRIMVPLAEISTAGVIMAVNTASDAVRASIVRLILASDEKQRQFLVRPAIFGVRRLDAALGPVDSYA